MCTRGAYLKGVAVMTLRLIILLLGVGALVAQFFVSLHDERAKTRENENLHAKLKAIHDGVAQLIVQGKLAKSDAQRLLVISESVHFKEDLYIEVNPGNVVR
jgi:hypothetical protein